MLYYNKYLKYKNKYIALKYGGSNQELFSELPNYIKKNDYSESDSDSEYDEMDMMGAYAIPNPPAIQLPYSDFTIEQLETHFTSNFTKR